MPKPIPEWDLARRLVKYVGFKQINGEEVTVKQTMRTLGIGRERIERVMRENEILYQIVGDEEEKSSEDRIAIKYAPNNLLGDAALSPVDLAKSFEETITGNFSGRQIRQRRLNKKQREKQKIDNFWSGSR